MNNNTANHSRRLGFFFLLAMLILGFATLVVGNLRLFSPAYEIQVQFDSIEGLKKGDDVRVDGVTMGKVTGFTLSDQGVRVFAELDQPVLLHEGDDITVESFSALGGNVVSIRRRHKAGAPVVSSKHLRGFPKPSAFDELGKFFTENGETIRKTLGNLEAITSQVRSGQGTVGKLLMETKVYDEIIAAIQSVQEALNKINKGTGTISKLLNDPALHDELVKTVGEIRAAVQKLSSGSGTLGKLLNDDTLYRDFLEITAKLKSAEGTLGKLLNDKEMAEDLKNAIKDIKATAASMKNITGKIESGKGDLGKLIQDEELHPKVKKLVEDMDKTIGKAARSIVSLGGEYRAYAESDQSLARLYLKIQPTDDKYFMAGAAIFGLRPESTSDYQDKLLNDDDTQFYPEVQASYRIPWILEKRLWARAGLFEGKPGGALDFHWEDFGFLQHPFTFTAEIRDVYNDVDKEDLDENVHGPMVRFYGRTSLARDGFFKYIKLVGGVSNLADEPEFFGGVGFEYDDEDLRSLIALIGLSR